MTQYELWKAIWSGLHDRNFFELDWALQRHNGFVARFAPATFVGNHDVTRIASHADPVLALVVLMTVGGIPLIYYGDEQGFVGEKEDRADGDDAIRPAFPEHPGELAAWGADTYRAHRALLGLRRRHPWLWPASTAAVTLTNDRYVYRSSSADGTQSITVELDVSGEPSATVRDGAGGVLWSR